MSSTLPDFLQTLLGSSWGIVLMLLFFNGSIAVHELGHYLAARWRGLKVTRFSLFGLGPKLISWRGKSGVEYCICALPFGAYVALPQMAEMKALEGEDGDLAGRLPPISYADKMIVAVAGPLFNIIFAAVLAAIVWGVGYPQPASFSTTTIGYVMPKLDLENNGSGDQSPAARADLRPGDKILKIDQVPVSRFAQVTELVALGGGVNADGEPQAIFTIERDGDVHEILVHPQLVTINSASGDQLRLVGISPAQEMRIGFVEPQSPAFHAGLVSGDALLTANGQKLYSVAQFSDILQQSNGAPVTLSIERDGEVFPLIIQPETIALTRPLAQLFASAADGSAALEIIPQYPANAAATAAAASAADKAVTDTSAAVRDLSSPSTVAHLAVFSLPGATGALSGMNGQWYVESVNGKRTDSIAALLAAVAIHSADKAVNLTLADSQGGRRELRLGSDARAELIAARTQSLVGFALDSGYALAYPSIASQFRQHLETTFRTLKSLFTPTSNIGLGHLSGPVGIGRAVYSLAISDIRLVLWFAVLLNLNLAILNLLPIPVLDGGHMAIATLSKLRGRPMPESFIAGLQGTFMILLLGLMVYILFKDSMRWYGDSEAERAWERQRQYAIPVQFIPRGQTPAPADASPAKADAPPASGQQ